MTVAIGVGSVPLEGRHRRVGMVLGTVVDLGADHSSAWCQSD